MIARLSYTVALRALAGATALGCADDPSAPSALARLTEVQGLTLSVAVSRAGLGPGDTAQVTVTLRNAADTAATVNGSSSCVLDFRVLDRRGAVVAPVDRICTADLRAFPIPAGGALSRAYRWGGEARLGAPAGARLPAGSYRIIGHAAVLLDRRVGRETVLTSGPATVDIRPR